MILNGQNVLQLAQIADFMLASPWQLDFGMPSLRESRDKKRKISLDFSPEPQDKRLPIRIGVYYAIGALDNGVLG
jgi:hypothetical protein